MKMPKPYDPCPQCRIGTLMPMKGRRGTPMPMRRNSICTTCHKMIVQMPKRNAYHWITAKGESGIVALN